VKSVIAAIKSLHTKMRAVENQVYKFGGYSMKAHSTGVRFIKMAFLLMLSAVTIAGCGGNWFTYKGDKVTQENLMIQLQEGNQQGEWKTNELAVKYQYQMTPETLKIEGTVELVGGFATGFNYISNLAVNLLFLDNQGTVIENSLVYSGNHSLVFSIPMQFERTIPVPEGARKISFAYDGKLVDAGGDDDITSYDIWFTPSR
jgi:hypothetical protein